jgi:hypothetical protein
MKKSLLFIPNTWKCFYLCTSTTNVAWTTAMTKIERFHLVFWISLNLNFFYFSQVFLYVSIFSFACYLFFHLLILFSVQQFSWFGWIAIKCIHIFIFLLYFFSKGRKNENIQIWMWETFFYYFSLSRDCESGKDLLYWLANGNEKLTINKSLKNKTR